MTDHHIRAIEPQAQAADPYRRRLAIGAARDRVFDAIATVEGVRGWWTAIASGSPATGGELHLGFAALAEHIVLRVEEARRPSLVRWRCLAHSGCPAWNGTAVTFELLEDGPGRCELRFAHAGLSADLVRDGWERFLASLAALAQTGRGTPFAGETLTVVRAYHDAWTGKDFARARACLAPALETEVPMNTYASAEDFGEALTAFGALVHRVDLLAELDRGDEALLLYDMATEPFGTIRIAEHFTVRDGLIVRIRHVHDTVALRAAAA